MAATANATNPVLERLDQIQAQLNARQTGVPTYKSDAATAGAVNKVFATPAGGDDMNPRGGFKSFSHFCKEVREAGVNNGVPKTKALTDYVQKAASGLNETVGAEGGFLVPPEFATELLRRTYDNDLMSRCSQRTCSGNSLKVPAIDETSRADGSRFGGIRMFWEAEASQMTSSKPTYSHVNLELKTLTGLVYVTTQLMEDSSIAMEQHLMQLFAEEGKFKIGDAIINGSGAGMPQGILNAPALVTVSKETGQAANTILFENVQKMWQRCFWDSQPKAVWLINQDTLHQLNAMFLPTGVAGQPVYLPPGGVSDKPYGSLFGRPVIPVEFCQTLGTVGDILLCDFSQYLVLKKGEAQTASSIHLRFDFNEVAFRVLLRLDGQLWWQSALTPKNGSNTLSPMVALQTRS